MAHLPGVLFVCVHNAGRSQMAAGNMTHYSEGRVVDELQVEGPSA